jgi:hypothetical protein
LRRPSRFASEHIFGWLNLKVTARVTIAESTFSRPSP